MQDAGCVFERKRDRERERERTRGGSNVRVPKLKRGNKGGRNKGSLMRTKKGTRKAKGVFMRMDFRARLAYDRLSSIC